LSFGTCGISWPWPTQAASRTAERIFIAQPTLSHQIRRLEEIIGTPLLQRRREGLRLTAAGPARGR
jgi:DNA-binding transcriptional LysR family regulator